MTGFMQQGVDRRVAAYIHVATDDAGFLVTPETAFDRLPIRLNMQGQAVARQQRCEHRQRHIGDCNNFF